MLHSDRRLSCSDAPRGEMKKRGLSLLPFTGISVSVNVGSKLGRYSWVQGYTSSL